MARTTVADVLDIIETDLTTAQVSAFIDDASAWVTDFLGGEGLSSARLTIIEKYLAAHYITMRDPRVTEADVDDVRERYQRGKSVTEYLRQAAAEDPSGVVRARLVVQDQATVPQWTFGLYDPD